MQEIIGRESALKEIRQRIETQKLVTIVGAVGVGKSALVSHLLKSKVTHLAQPNNPVPEDFEGIVVVDDADCDLEYAKRVVSERRESNSIVVTSRLPLGLVRESIYRLDPLAPSDAIELFLTHYNGGQPLPDSEMCSAEALVSRLNRIPLALEMAASRCRTLGLEVHDRLREPGFLAGPNGGRFTSWDEACSSLHKHFNEDTRNILRLSDTGGTIPVSEIEAMAQKLTSDSKPLEALAQLVDSGLISIDDQAVTYVGLGDVTKPDSFVADCAKCLSGLVAPLIEGARMGEPATLQRLLNLSVLLSWTVDRLDDFDDFPEVVDGYLILATIGKLDLGLLNRIEKNAKSRLVKKALGLVWAEHELFDRAHAIWDGMENSGSLDDESRVERFYWSRRMRFTATRPAVVEPLLQARLDIADVVEAMMLETPGAIEQADQSRRRIKILGDVRWEIRILISVGNAFLGAARLDDAIGKYSRAQELLANSPNRPCELNVFVNIASANGRVGRLQESIENYSHIRSLLDPVGTPQTAGVLFYNLGNSFSAIGEYAKAVRCFDEGLDRIERNSEVYEHLERLLLQRQCAQFMKSGKWTHIRFGLKEESECQAIMEGFLGRRDTDVVPSDDPRWGFVDLAASELSMPDFFEQLRTLLEQDFHYHRTLASGAMRKMDRDTQIRIFAEYSISVNRFNDNLPGFFGVTADYAWLRLGDGTWTNLVDVVARLVEALLAHPDGLSDQDMYRIVWPEDRSKETSLYNRLKSSVSRARKLGLRVERIDEKYQLVTPMIIFSWGSWRVV